MFCKNCGAALKEGAKFCSGCGQAVASVPPVSNGEFLYSLSFNYKETGPYTLQQLRRMAADKQFTREYSVRRADSSEWKAVGDYPELKDLVAIRLVELGFALKYAIFFAFCGALAGLVIHLIVKYLAKWDIPVLLDIKSSALLFATGAAIRHMGQCGKDDFAYGDDCWVLYLIMPVLGIVGAIMTMDKSNGIVGVVLYFGCFAQQCDYVDCQAGKYNSKFMHALSTIGKYLSGAGILCIMELRWRFFEQGLSSAVYTVLGDIGTLAMLYVFLFAIVTFIWAMVRYAKAKGA